MDIDDLIKKIRATAPEFDPSKIKSMNLNVSCKL